MLLSLFVHLFIFYTIVPTPISPLFPYTTLFRSAYLDELHIGRVKAGGKVEVTFRGSTTVYKGTIARVAPTVKRMQRDRKSTRLNSSHRCISYAVFCLKKKKQTKKCQKHQQIDKQ